MLVTVNSRLKFEIEIVHDLLCHHIFRMRMNEQEINSIRRIHVSIKAILVQIGSLYTDSNRNDFQNVMGTSLYKDISRVNLA